MELVVEIAESGSGPGEMPGALASQAAPAAAKALLPPDGITSATDDALVRAALVGQQEAFAELVRRYTRMVLWHASGRIKDQTEVEEIAQETLVRAYVNLARLRAPRAFGGWLIAIADSVVREKHRMDSKVISLESPDEAVETPPEAAPAEVLSREEMREKLLVEMRRLPAHYRVALALKYMKGYSVDQIAEQLLLPAGTVRARLSRAYGMLRRRLESPSPKGEGGSSETPGPPENAGAPINPEEVR